MMYFLAEGGRPILSLSNLYMTYLLKIFRGKGNLVDTVMATAFFKCGVPHDHLYSLLSVPHPPSGLVADYSLSVEEVCMRFAETTLVADQNLRLLSLAPHTSALLAGQAPARHAGLPTWVPDLSCQGPVNPLVSYTIRPQLFHAGGRDDPSNITIAADRRLLHVRGRVVDSVATMARPQLDVPFPTEEEVQPKSGFHARVKKRLANWLAECYEVAGEKYVRKEANVGADEQAQAMVPEESKEETELRRGFLETLLCGMTGLRDPVPEEVLAATQVYVDYLFGYFTAGYSLSEDVRQTMLTYGVLVEQSLFAMAEARRFCRTEQGRLGQIRIEAREGDVFVCIVGAEVPYLLRPSEEEGVYTLVGDSFLLGVMQGEAFSDARYETVDITIE
jgi:hypothetical protein